MQGKTREGIPLHRQLRCSANHVQSQCDEQQPSCANCVKQGTPCEYRLLGDRTQSNGSPLPVSSITPSSAEAAPPDTAHATPNTAICQNPELVLNVSQLQLLHHYTTVTAKTLAYSPVAQHVFESSLVLAGFQHAYLLHSILALAALHLSKLTDRSHPDRNEYMRLADLHYDAALADFRARVSDIDDSNWQPILFFAGVLFPYSCTTSISVTNDVEQALSSFITNLILTRRTRPLVVTYYEEMISSELAEVIPEDVRGHDWTSAEAPAETELVQLRRFSEVVHHLYPPDIVDAYGQAIHVLELCFDVTTRYNNSPTDALLKIWMHFISDRYIELLSEKAPGSLIILAHYAVLIHRGRRYWYLEGVAQQLLEIAIAFVPSEWSAWLDWPKAQIQGGTPNESVV